MTPLLLPDHVLSKYYPLLIQWNVTSYAYEWFVPVLDLVEIYDDYYGEEDNVMTEEIVNTCSGMLLVGR